MLDPNSRQVLDEFVTRWNHSLKVSQVLELDGTWPSIGTLDLLTYSLRLDPELSLPYDQLVRGVAVYLANIGSKCWSKVASKVSVSIEEDRGVVITASGGANIPAGESVSMDIEASLRDVLRYVPDPFPVFNDAARRISFDNNIISLLALGLCTGLGPAVNGAWSGQKRETFAPVLDLLRRELAQQTAQFYARSFPNEPLGAVAELYLSPLIDPPLFFGEELPAHNAINAVLDYCEEFKVGHTQLIALAKNLATLADDTLSAAGIALCGALYQEIPPAVVIASALSRSSFVGLLRPAMYDARSRLFLEEGDWIVREGEIPADINRLKVEAEMNFIPWLYLPIQRLADPKSWPTLRPLLITLAAFDLEESIAIADKILAETPGDLQLRLQRIKLEVLADSDRVDAMFRALLSEPGADASPRLYYLWGSYFLRRGEPETAKKYCKAAVGICPAEDPIYSDALNNLAWSEILLQDYQAALEHIELGLAASICPVTLLLNKAFCLFNLGRSQEAREIQLRLLRLAPFDRRVFGGLGALISVG